MSFLPSNTYGNTFLPAYRDFDIDDDQLRILLATVYSQTVNSLNLKINGVYETVEVQTNSQFNNPANAQRKRFEFRKMFYISAGSLTFLHNIPGISLGTSQFTRIYGVVNTATDWLPLPHVDVVNVNRQISIQVNATQVIITPGAGAPAITGGIVVLEYLKN